MTDFQNLQLLLDLLINYRFQLINFDKFIENFTLFLWCRRFPFNNSLSGT